MKESRGGKQLVMEKKKTKKEKGRGEQCFNNDPSKMWYKKKNRFTRWGKLVSKGTWIKRKSSAMMDNDERLRTNNNKREEL